MSVRKVYSVIVSDDFVGGATVYSGSYKICMDVYKAFESYFDCVFAPSFDPGLPYSRPVVTLSFRPILKKGDVFNV